MTPYYIEEEFNAAKSTDKLSLICENCNSVFFIEKKYISTLMKFPNYNKKLKYCSIQCKGKSLNKSVALKCISCNKDIIKKLSQIKKTKNQFCSRSCSVKYNNAHKIKGYRRSKLEKYIEEQLNAHYPDLKIDFNKCNEIDSELDIFIPEFKLAFELNGIFHYEPIYGKCKFEQIKNNDSYKVRACVNRGIELCVIDTSQQKHFKEDTSKKYLNIILSTIRRKTC